jgi:hypothetical protein
MALQMEAPELDLQLPENFPDGWQENDSSNQSMNNKRRIIPDEADTSLLQLTTSRLQKDIR